ncbi:MAG: glutamate-1-semialdehyde 2,1-aminomutase [Bacteroidota bacterium]
MSIATRSIAKSEALFEAAVKVMPGGVNSPVRAFKSVGGTPIFMEKAEGAILTDADGHTYIDYINSWGPMILGHAWQPMIDAVKEYIGYSASFGAPTSLEVDMAQLVIDMVPGMDRVRMVNSGTEACMSAIRLARGYTGKDKVIKFAGNYHGHGDSFLIQAGSGALTLGVPNSPGVTEATAANTLLARYNDLASVQALADANRGEIAALILEPVAGNMGCIPPQPGFLEGLRELCTAEGIVLIFDEVMTGFRLAPGGAQERFGITADLVTLGKIIGGGMPVGAYGGKAEIMDHVAPVGPVYQAGTLSGNPIAMISGYTQLKALKDEPAIYARIDARGAQLRAGIAERLDASPFAYQINQLGSMISVHFCEEPVVDYESAAAGNNPHFKAFFHGLLNRGVYLPPSAFESWFLSDALTDGLIQDTLDAVEGTLAEMVK